jgi:hypothetical protein
MDRFFDNYISTSQQTIVFDRLRPEAERNARSDADARFDRLRPEAERNARSDADARSEKN